MVEIMFCIGESSVWLPGPGDGVKVSLEVMSGDRHNTALLALSVSTLLLC